MRYAEPDQHLVDASQRVFLANSRINLEVQMASAHSGSCSGDLAIGPKPFLQRFLDLVAVDRQPRENNLEEHANLPIGTARI